MMSAIFAVFILASWPLARVIELAAGWMFARLRRWQGFSVPEKSTRPALSLLSEREKKVEPGWQTVGGRPELRG